jgi:preprotein translocase SecE subunit
VAWPSRREVVTFTTVTLVTSAFVTVFTFGLDIVFKESVLKLVELIT